MRPAALVLLLGTLHLGCAEPPSKEMNQAQGAIDAARAAGADEFAPTELNAAIEALQQSEAAVGQRDYRLALSHAIDSRERAQEAAKAAVTARARARGDVERTLAEAAALLAQARARLDDPGTSATRRAPAAQPRAIIEAADKSLQDARTALSRDDYATAMKALQGVAERIQAALDAMAEPTGAGPARRRR